VSRQTTVGTRGSDLALVQAREAAGRLESAHPGLRVSLKTIRTAGDSDQGTSLSMPGILEKGLFTGELGRALLSGEIDAAVHSLKDLPVEPQPGLVIGAVLERADPGDCLASKHPGGVQGLPQGSLVGTCSPRRANQLLAMRPDLRIADIRGNIGTRFQKLAGTPGLAAFVVARAALARLGESVVPPGIQISTIAEMLPAPGQGAIAIECRFDDAATLALLSAIDHTPTRLCVDAERALLKSLGGGCAMPLGALARLEDGKVQIRAAVFEPSGIRWIAGGPHPPHT
jgi:hydroxymethylbilane synthase